MIPAAAPDVPPDAPRPGRRWALEGAWASAAFAARTTAAAQLALLAAWHLGLRHTYWAAMTVWLIAQPTRGRLFEKSVLRVVGTLAGAAVGFGLLTLFPGHTLALICGLTLWTALCAGAGALTRAARAYGFIMAGYTAVMLALPASGGGASTQGLFADRVLCTLIGVLASAVVTGLFTPREPREDLDALLRQLADAVFAFAFQVRSAPTAGEVPARQRHLVARIGLLGARADLAISGFFFTRARRRKVRRALRALLGLLVESRLAGERSAASPAGPRAAGEAPPEPTPSSASGDALVARIRAGAVRWRPRSSAAQEGAPAGGAAPATAPALAHRTPGARSWANLGEAALATAKTATGMALVGAIWWATGWKDGSTMLVSAAVFLTLFSGNESARALVRQVLFGSMGGAAAALLYVLLLPLATRPAETVLLAIPFLLAGAWAMARPLTAKAAIDFNMVFLLATPAAFSLRGSPGETASRGLAIVVGVLAATLFFHATHETVRERIARLAREVKRDVRGLAASADVEEARLRRSALADRVVRMAIAAELDARFAPFAEAAIDLLGLGSALARLVPLRDVPGSSGPESRPIAAALGRFETDWHRSAGLALELERAAESLGRTAPSTSAVRDAVQGLRDTARIVRREQVLLDR